ncbi:hypothetical protein AB0E59_28035 [Lentzea sp. NPDC034063]|uniref:hypothetical protein n=1 Tax=unclassified Lentzea TaxID=2643253 RepID=UPI0033FCE3AD
MREVGASIDAAERVLLGELRYPNQRFGVELAWDERGQPHVSPQAVPVFPRVTSPAQVPDADGRMPRRRLDFEPDCRHARRHSEIYRRGDRPWLRTVAVTGTLLAVGGALFVLSGQWRGSRSYGPQVKESHESSRDWNCRPRSDPPSPPPRCSPARSPAVAGASG